MPDSLENYGGADWARVSKHAQQRRAQLGSPTVASLARDSGASHQAVKRLLEGDAFHRASKLSQFEAAFGWTFGSILTVLDGGEPTLVEEPATLDLILAEIRALRTEIKELKANN